MPTVLSVRKLGASAVAAAAAFSAIALVFGPVSPAHAATPPTAAGTFGALKPARILDTRGTGAAVVPLGTISVQVLGRAGVPATGVSAVVLNVTATEATSAGALTVWADGTPQPRASNLQFGLGKTVPNQVIAPVGADGKVALHNGSGGYLQLIADVSGYFVAGAPTVPGAFGSLAPARLLDTRNGTGVHAGPVQPQGSVALQVAGRSGVPSTGASAVVLNVTVAGPKATGVLSVWAHGATQPVASNLNFTHGQTIANLVVAPIGADGRVSLQNRSGGALQLVADVAGYFVAGAPVNAGAFSPVAPQRLLDTRNGTGIHAGAVPAHGAISLQVAGRGGVPLTGISAVEINVTATGGSAHGVITVWPTGTAMPTASSLNYVAGQTVPNLVLAPLGPDGKIQLMNNSGGTVHLVADVSGYFLGSPLAIPTATTSRYVRGITGAGTDAAKLNTQGCADASANGAGSHFSLLQIGAQSITAPLSSVNPGVVLSATSTRLTYSQLVTALTGYITGYDTCAAANDKLTLAIGTSSDGDFTAYSASQKGTDWADKVVDPLQTAGTAHNVIVDGSIDAEASFAATELQVEQWESAFLNASPARLVFAGSADACPTDVGAVKAACGPVTSSLGVSQTWTQAQYYRLAAGLSPARIVALPQVYSRTQASQWANIALSGPTAGQTISFLGALTQFAACGAACSLSASQGWAALYLSLSANAATAPANLAVSTDLRIDS